MYLRIEGCFVDMFRFLLFDSFYWIIVSSLKSVIKSSPVMLISLPSHIFRSPITVKDTA